MEVEVQDEGRYRCYTSTSNGHDQSIIHLNVNAQVREVSVDWTGSRMTCSSDRIYPEPVLTWSTEPSSTSSLQGNTTVKITKEHLYNITSSMILSDSDDGLNYSCNISTHRNWRKVTMRQQPVINTDHTEIPCSASNVSLWGFGLRWIFNHSQIIVNRSLTNITKVSDQWTQHVRKVSESGNLFLQDLSPSQGGIYTCELSQAQKAQITETVLRITQDRQTLNVGGLIAAVFISFLLIFILVYYRHKICTPRRVKNTCGMSKNICLDF